MDQLRQTELLSESAYLALEGPPPHGSGVNAYVCDLCGSMLVTIDRTAGVTPFMMACENDACKRTPEQRKADAAADEKASRLIAVAGRRTANGGKPKPNVIAWMPDNSPVSARSCMYRTPFHVTQATVEFYRPEYSVYASMKPGPLRDHVTNGGLLFRHIGTTSDPNIEEIEKGYGDRKN